MNNRKSSPKNLLRSLFRKPPDSNNLSQQLTTDDQQCDALRAEIEKGKLELTELKSKIDDQTKFIKKLKSKIDNAQAQIELNEINYQLFPANEDFKNNSVAAAQVKAEDMLTQDEAKAELEKLRGACIAVESRLNLLELNLSEGIPTININALNHG